MLHPSGHRVEEVGEAAGTCILSMWMQYGVYSPSKWHNLTW